MYCHRRATRQQRLCARPFKPGYQRLDVALLIARCKFNHKSDQQKSATDMLSLHINDEEYVQSHDEECVLTEFCMTAMTLPVRKTSCGLEVNTRATEILTWRWIFTSRRLESGWVFISIAFGPRRNTHVHDVTTDIYRTSPIRHSNPFRRHFTRSTAVPTSQST